MAASVLDGEKICEVSGKVKWSSLELCNLTYQYGSIALYKLSSSYYVHARTTSKRVKVWRCNFPFICRRCYVIAMRYSVIAVLRIVMHLDMILF